MTVGARFKGFTLVELLVVMSLLSLVMLALGGAMRGMAQTGDRIDIRLARADELRVAAGFLRTCLERVSARKLEGLPAGENALPFSASADALDWIGVMPARYGAGGRHFFRLGLAPGAAGQQNLVIFFKPVAGVVGRPDWSGAQMRVLAEQVTGLQIQYQDGRAEGAPWRQDWPLKDRLPSGISISVQTLAGRWPPIAMAVHVTPGADDGSSPFVTGGGR